MADDNKRNLQYFEAASMSALFNAMESWQQEHRKRFQSISIQREDGQICCIAVTNPSEVIVVDGRFEDGVEVSGDHAMKTWVDGGVVKLMER